MNEEREKEDLVGVSEEVAEDRVRRSHVIDCGDLQREQPIGKNRRNITKRGRELNCMKCMIKHNITSCKEYIKAGCVGEICSFFTNIIFVVTHCTEPPANWTFCARLLVYL